MTKRKQEGPSEYKTFPAFELKYDEDQGLVEHIFTLFGVIDHGKDRSHPGSFKKTLSERGDKVRVLDMHKTDSVMRIVGKPLAIRELSREELPAKLREEYPEATGGVWAQTKFFLETPEGKGAFLRIKEGVVEWSYGYDALDVDHSTIKMDGEDVEVRDLKQVRLYEYGPVLFGMVPGTTTLSAKADGEPDEAKPAPEVTENTIRIRVRDPGDFEDDSFRTINIGDSDSGIQAVVGKLDGETTMTIQSYIFSKDKFTVDKAQAWVDEHKKDGVPDLDEKQDDEEAQTFECIECGHKVTADEMPEECPECGAEMRPVKAGDELDEEQEKAADPKPETKNEPPEAVVFASVVLQDTLAKLEPETWEYKAAELALIKLRGLYGDEVDVAELEDKAGRVLAARNAQRIGQALASLISVLEDAGIDVPGVGKKPEPEPEDEEQAGKDWSLEIEAAELDLLELDSDNRI